MLSAVTSSADFAAFRPSLAERMQADRTREDREERARDTQPHPRRVGSSSDGRGGTVQVWGAAFVAQLVGGVESRAATGDAVGPTDPGEGTGPDDGGVGPMGPGPGSLGPTSHVTMSDGDGYDLWAGLTVQGASSFPSDAGLWAGDFRISSDGGTTSFLPGENQFAEFAVLRGTTMAQASSATDLAWSSATTPFTLGNGDVAAVRMYGQYTFLVGNPASGQDGSVSFDVARVEETEVSTTTTDAGPSVATVLLAGLAYANALTLAAVTGGSVTRDGAVYGGATGGGTVTSVAGGGGAPTASPASTGTATTQVTD